MVYEEGLHGGFQVDRHTYPSSLYQLHHSHQNSDEILIMILDKLETRKHISIYEFLPPHYHKL